MSFAVMRAAKRGAGGLGAATTHNLDRLDLPNVDKELIHLNKCLQGNSDILDAVHKRLNDVGITPRKNACLAVEFVISASPEFYRFNKQDSEKQPGKKTLIGNYNQLRQYEQAALEWFNQKYGKENVVAVNRHMDEKTPHLHVFVVPLIRKEVSLTRQRKDKPIKQRRAEQRLILSGTQVMGGPKEMAEMQTSFATAVAHLRLSRGIAGTGAKHTTTKQYSALTAAATTGKNIEVVQKTLDLLGNRRDRIDQDVLQQMKKALTEQGLSFYKGTFMTSDQAKQAQEVERQARAARKEEATKPSLKTKSETPVQTPIPKPAITKVQNPVQKGGKKPKNGVKMK